MDFPLTFSQRIKHSDERRYFYSKSKELGNLPNIIWFSHILSSNIKSRVNRIMQAFLDKYRLPYHSVKCKRPNQK